MITWFLLAIIATILFGVQSFLYKSSARKGYNKFLVVFIFMITVEILALISFFITKSAFKNIPLTIFLGFIFAVAFLLTTIGLFKALEYIPSNKVFPITSSSIILIVLYGVIFFKESLMWINVLGIVILFITVIFLHKDKDDTKKPHEQKKGVLICIGVIFTSAIMVITNKYAAVYTEMNSFIVVNYLFSAIFAFIIYKIYTKHKSSPITLKFSILLGAIIGGFNFIAYRLYLTAMKTGDITIIGPIGAINIIVVVILSTIFYKEKLTWKRILLILLAIVGITLLKIGV